MINKLLKILVFVLAVFVAAAVGSDVSTKRILLLYSYDPAFPTSEKIISGLVSAFPDSKPIIDQEFLDSKRLWDEASQQHALMTLAHKYRFRPAYDVVVVADDHAFNFALQHKAELFAAAPIVFLGVNDLDSAIKGSELPNVQGVAEVPSFYKTLDTATSLFPQRSQLHIITDASVTGQADLNAIRQLQNQFPQFHFNLLDLTHLSWPELTDQITELGSQDLIFLLSAFHDKTQTEKSFNASLALIVAHSQVPVLHFWEHGIGDGLFGGVVVSLYEQAYQAGLMVQELLAGNEIAPALLTENANVPMFDYTQLARFKVAQEQLPAGSIVLNKPVTLWHTHRTELIFIAALVFILLLTITYLTRQNLAMKMLSNKLSENSSFLKLLMNTLPDLVWTKDPQGIYVNCNKRFEDFFGANAAEIIGKSDADFLEQSQAAAFRKDDLRVIQLGRAISVEEEVYFKSDGHYELLETIKTPVYNTHSGELLGVLGVSRDITERRKSELVIRENEKKYRVLFEQITQGVLVYDQHLCVIDVNPAALVILGKNRADILQREFLPASWFADDRPVEVLNTDLALDSLFSQHVLRKNVLLKGWHPLREKNVWLLVDIVPLAIAEQQSARLFVSINDVTEQKAAEASLRLAASVFESCAEGVVIADAEQRILDVNRSFSELTGYTKAEAIGQTLQILESAMIQPDVYREVQHALTQQGMWQGELQHRHKAGSTLAVWQTITAVKDNTHALSHYVTVFSDISPLKQSQQETYYLAMHDVLTGLPNRRFLNEQLALKIQQANLNNSIFAVAYLDLDNFKMINDTLGHCEGDKVLEVVTSYLKQLSGSESLVARVGGDEFVILIVSSSKQAVQQLANAMLEHIERPLLLSGQRIIMSASMGICFYPADGQDAGDLLRNADIAMYRAKQQGKKRCLFYDKSMADDILARAQIEIELRQAISRNELALAYQPQYNLNSQKIVGVEALLRWNSHKLGPVSPDRMIPVAEESGLILPLGLWVLNEAIRQAKHWQNSGLDVGRVAVNVAGPQLYSGELVGQIEKMLALHAVSANSLALEVTETFIMQHSAIAIRQLQQLHDLGIEIAIDDFGTGYSSLSHLKSLPVNKLKIDKSFINELPGNTDDIAITRTIIALANSLSLHVIAEGVETEAQARCLMLQGCTEAQGYLFSKPVPGSEIASLMRQQQSPLPLES